MSINIARDYSTGSDNDPRYFITGLRAYDLEALAGRTIHGDVIETYVPSMLQSEARYFVTDLKPKAPGEDEYNKLSVVERNIIDVYLGAGQPIQAIKFVRAMARPGLGLKEAKDVVDYAKSQRD